MSIFEYDEAAHMKLVREEGINEGLEKGINVGELSKLIFQIQKKIEKGLDAAQIADALETDPNTVASITKLIYANPQMSPRRLVEIYLK